MNVECMNASSNLLIKKMERLFAIFNGLFIRTYKYRSDV
jgi:hypothetical protein